MRLARPMTCEGTQGMAGELHWGAPARACCTFSSAPTRPLGEAASRSLVAHLCEGEMVRSAELGACGSSPPAMARASLPDASAGLLPLYLRLAVLRI